MRLIKVSGHVILPSRSVARARRELTARQSEVRQYADEVLPERLDAVVAEMNEQLGHVLPDGGYFEWTAEQ